MKYDVIIIGAGPGGIFAGYELMQKAPELKIGIFESGHPLEKRKCPIDGVKIKSCIKCPSCSIMNGFGGAGAFSDGKYNITNDFGGTLYEHIGKSQAIELMNYVDAINVSHGGEGTKMYSTAGSNFKTVCMQNKLKLLNASVRHLGTDINYIVLKNLYAEMQEKMDFYFRTPVETVEKTEDGYRIHTAKESYDCKEIIISVGRSGSKWMEKVCKELDIPTSSNRVDIGVRVETNNIVMDEVNKYLYEGKFIYNTSGGTTVRTFCSNPSGHVVIENNNGIIVVNGHSFTDPKLGSDNTNFALLVSHTFTKPFKDPNEYASIIAGLANKLSGGTVIVQKFGDILVGRRSTRKRIEEGFVKPTLKEAVPGDLSLILPHKTMQSLIDMIKALDHVTPGIANDHTLFYGVEAKFYSDRVACNSKFETKIRHLYVGGDGAGITRGLAQAGSNGVAVARNIIEDNSK